MAWSREIQIHDDREKWIFDCSSKLQTETMLNLMAWPFLTRNLPMFTQLPFVAHFFLNAAQKDRDNEL